jgi:hypothetical protein
MNEDRFDELMRDAAHTYRRPPEPELEAMWSGIEATLGDQRHLHVGRRSRMAILAPRWLAIAATLVVGIGLGRLSVKMGRGNTPAAPPTIVASAKPAANTTPESGPYDVETSKYLGQTAALLIALPSEVKAGRANEQFVGRASELLSRTRLLIDSPAASGPQMRALLEDLELVLAQVVRLQNDSSSRIELDLINRALEQRDVIPRLRTAVADISAN